MHHLTPLNIENSQFIKMPASSVPIKFKSTNKHDVSSFTEKSILTVCQWEGSSFHIILVYNTNWIGQLATVPKVR